MQNQVLSASLENPFAGTSEQNSPNDWILEKDIAVYEDKIIISVENAKWATFADTNSMDPVLDKGANAIQIVPAYEEQLQVGDIITYNQGNISIIHRIIEIGNDGDWYAITKGDNNNSPDAGKVRFSQVEKVVIGILY